MSLLRDKILRETYMVSKLCGMIKRGELRENHPQQRKSGQWTNEVRDNFIVTVIQNEDFDPIKICEQLTEEGIILWLIDGLQRSTTIENYKAGRFKLGKNINPSTVVYQDVVKGENGEMSFQNVEFDLRNKAYIDLPEKLKEEFDNCPVNVIKHLACTDEEVGRHILRYNSGCAMKPAQKISTYMPRMAKKVKELSNHAFFNDCVVVSDAKDKSGELDKIVCECMMAVNFFDKWNKDVKAIGKHLETHATDEMFNTFEGYLDRLLEIVTPEMGKLFIEKNSTKNCLVWMMFFDKFAKTGLSDDKFKSFLENFDELKQIKMKVENMYELEKNSGEYSNVLSFSQIDGSKSTKDKGIMKDKLSILERLMNDFLHIDMVKLVEENEEDVVETMETEMDSIDTLMFVKNTVNPSITSEDVELYEAMLDDCVCIDSPIHTQENIPSLLSMIAYGMEEDKDKEVCEWLTNYAKTATTYIACQRQNFAYMLNEFRKGIA